MFLRISIEKAESSRFYNSYTYLTYLLSFSYYISYYISGIFVTVLLHLRIAISPNVYVELSFWF